MRVHKASGWAWKPCSLCLIGQMVMVGGAAFAASGEDVASLTEEIRVEREQQFDAIEELYQTAAELAAENKYREADDAYARVLSRLQAMPGELAFRRAKSIESEYKAFKSIWARSILEDARKQFRDGNYTQAILVANDVNLIDSRYANEVTALVDDCNKMIKSDDYRRAIALETSAPDHEDKVEELQIMMRQAWVYFEGGRLEDARATLEKIFVIDPYYEPAIVFLERVYGKMYQYGTARFKAEAAAMEGYMNWNTVVPVLQTQSRSNILPTPVSRALSSTDIMQKMEKIIFPRIEFDKQDIFSAINFLKRYSLLYDPDKTGIQVVGLLTLQEAEPLPHITMVMNNIPMSEVVRYICQATGLKYRVDNGGVFIGKTVDELQTESFPIRREVISRLSEGEIDTTAGGILNNRRVNPVLPTGQNALPFDGGELNYPVTGGGKNAQGGGYTGGITRVPGVGASSSSRSNSKSSSPRTSASASRINDAMSTGGVTGGSEASFTYDPAAIEFAKKLEPVSSTRLVQYFEERGIPFGPKSSVAYDLRGNKLIVTNTLENLRKMDNLLRQLNVEVPMVLVEARIVEVSEAHMDQLGFNWVLSVAAAGSSHPGWGINDDVGSAGQQGNDNPLRLSSSPSVLSGLKIFPNFGESLFGTDMNVDLSLSVNAISNNSKAEVLNSPRILTASGTQAYLEMTETRYLPEDWDFGDDESDSDSSSSNSNNNDWGNGIGTIEAPTPSFGNGRDLGVKFAVRPVVGPDNYTITLDLNLNITSYISDWTYDYTNVVYQISPTGESRDWTAKEFLRLTSTIWMPIYAHRDLNVRAKIYDGETIVIGGMIDSRTTNYDDKWPILGDIPLIGRFFQMKAEISDKTNLLIFVTTRLINNDGVPLRSERANRGVPSFPY